MSTRLTFAAGLLWCLVLGLPSLGCTHGCPLGLHGVVSVTPKDSSELVPCCGGFATKDLALLPSTEGQISLMNAGNGAQQVDAFLVPATCSKLFDGSYPGAQPLCQVYIGPVSQTVKSARVKLDAGTYRLWLQAYGANTASASYFISFDVLDYRCLPIVP